MIHRQSNFYFNEAKQVLNFGGTFKLGDRNCRSSQMRRIYSYTAPTSCEAVKAP